MESGPVSVLPNKQTRAYHRINPFSVAHYGLIHSLLTTYAIYSCYTVIKKKPKPLVKPTSHKSYLKLDTPRLLIVSPKSRNTYPSQPAGSEMKDPKQRELYP